MKRIYIILALLHLSNFSFGNTPKELNNKTKFKAGPSPKFWKYALLPVTCFLPIWGAYDEGSHTNDDTPLLNFDRGYECEFRTTMLLVITLILAAALQTSLTIMMIL